MLRTDRKVCVIGLGYIGLPTACMFAMAGHRVVGVDTNPEVVRWLNGGHVHIQEPDLNAIVGAAIGSGNLVIRDKPPEADAFIIAVPTPITRDKRADLSCVISAAESIIPVLKKGNLVILESTVPQCTTRDTLLPILSRTGLAFGDELFVAYSPERVLPGRILLEMVQNDRVVGGIDSRSAQLCKELYSSFVKGEIFLTEATTAEMVKLMENAYRDVNIALANEFALIAQQSGVNIWEARLLANKHPRVEILSPGPGVGGHCIAVDPWFLVEKYPSSGKLIKASREINDAMPGHVMTILEQELGCVANATVTLFGVTYKANVDDIRESPALEVMRKASEMGYEVRIHDPFVAQIPGGGKTLDLSDSLRSSDCIVLLADHSDFKEISPVTAFHLMRHKILIDTRNSLDHLLWQRHGFKVVVLGKGDNATDNK